MSFRAGFGLVMPAQRLLNFKQDPASFRTRLALPKKNEALPADTAVNFGISARALAKNLHIKKASPDAGPSTSIDLK
jgi:hypothetical protein